MIDVAKVLAEIAVTGIPLSIHPGQLLGGGYVPANQLAGHVNQRVRLAGFLATARTARTQKGRTMGFVTLEDFSGMSEVSFFPDQMEVYRKIRRFDGGPVWVEGKVSEHLSSLTVEGQGCGRLELCA